MNNNLAKQLQQAHHRGYVQGVTDGKEFAFSLLTVALNNTYGFAGDRIKVVSDELQRLWDEEFKDDPESGARHLFARLNQIKGIQCGKEKKY